MNKQGHRTRLLVRGALLSNCCSFSPQPCLFFPSLQPQISYCCSNENAAIRLHTAHKRHTTIAVTATMLCVRLVQRRLSALPQATAVACCETEPKWRQMHRRDLIYWQRLKIIIFQEFSGLIPSWYLKIMLCGMSKAKRCL